MAKGNVKSEKTTITKVVETKIPAITLTMDIPTAEFLKEVMNKIGGHPDFSARGYEHSISQGLREAGISAFPDHYEITGHLFCEME